MRDFKGMKRQRGRNRKPGGPSNANSANPNRSWDSQGPENIKVRGNAQTVYERYQQLARDAGASGDRVLAENYLQHAEHYFRVLRALQPQRPVSEIAARELSNQGYDIDFEDETGAQAAAFLAAQQAADRAAQGGDRDRDQNRSDNDGQQRDRDQNRDQNRDQPRGEGQQREWRDRDNNRDRDRDNRERDNNRDRDQNRDRDRSENPRADQPRADAPREDREPRPEGVRAEGDEGGRRETRRERWERRREERNRRFEAEGGVGEAPPEAGDEPMEPSVALAGTPYEPAAGDAAPAPAPAPAPVRAERPRRTRMPREDDAGEGPSALPGFLTRSTAPAPAAMSETAAAKDTDAPAPKRRAPRRKPEATAAED